MIKRIIYTSRVAGPLDEVSVDALARQIAAVNERLDVTGFLVFDGRTFLQCLEGPPDAVDEVFERVLTDRRHHSIALIEAAVARERHFADWPMGVVDTRVLDGSACFASSSAECVDWTSLEPADALDVLELMALLQARLSFAHGGHLATLRR